MKTDADPNANGGRRDAQRTPNEAAGKLITLTNERIAKHPEYESNRPKAYLETYNAVCSENPLWSRPPTRPPEIRLAAKNAQNTESLFFATSAISRLLKTEN